MTVVCNVVTAFSIAALTDILQTRTAAHNTALAGLPDPSHPAPAAERLARAHRARVVGRVGHIAARDTRNQKP